MLVLLLGLAWVLMLLLLRELASGWRAAALAAAAAWGVALVVMTELLSMFEALTFPWVTTCWCALCAALLAAYAHRRKRRLAGQLPRSRDGSLGWPLRLLLIGVALICILTGLTALVSPPNNWDSMTYHMARVVHWIQNGSVAHYPTHLVYQVYSNPGAELIVTNLQILARGDWAANLAQWFAFLGCIVGASAIAELLGAHARGQVYAAVVAASTPMAILQASSTQVDLVASFWLVGFTFFSLRVMRPAQEEKGGSRWLDVSAAGASLGLAVLTKGTVWAFAFPVVVWLLAYIALSKAPGRALRRVAFIAVIVAIALGLNAGHLSRNAHYSSLVRGGPDMPRTWNASLTSPTTLLSNLLRNASLEMPYTGRLVSAAHSVLGLDVSDQRTTLAGSVFTPPGLSNDEDSAGNPLELALVLLASAAVLAVPSLRRRRVLLLYLLSLVLATVLFCLLFRWQPWGGRLLLPLFMLASPLVAVVMEAIDPATISRFAERWRWPLAGVVIACGALLVGACAWWWPRVSSGEARAFLLAALLAAVLALLLVLFFLVARKEGPTDWVAVFCMVLLLSAYPYALANSSRPLVGRGSVLASDRAQLSFVNRPELLDPYTRAADYIRRSGARDVGLIMGGDTWEYPLWALLENEAGGAPRIEHIDVENSTGRTAVPSQGFDPELGVVVGLDMGDSFSDAYGDYVRVRGFEGQDGVPVYLYRRAGDETGDARLGKPLSVTIVRASGAYLSAAPALVTTRLVAGVTMQGVLSSLATVKDAASSHQLWMARPWRSTVAVSTW